MATKQLDAVLVRKNFHLLALKWLTGIILFLQKRLPENPERNKRRADVITVRLNVLGLLLAKFDRLTEAEADGILVLAQIKALPPSK